MLSIENDDFWWNFFYLFCISVWDFFLDCIDVSAYFYRFFILHVAEMLSIALDIQLHRRNRK